MTALLDRTRRPASRRRRESRPTLEGLEDRQLLYATLGGAWVYGARITYSFVPDGTSIGGVPSNMFATLNKVTTTANWQTAIQKAAAVWSSYANINLALVPDNGAPLGANGNQQGDPRFGDIRFSMIPQGTGALAFALLPPPYNGDSAAGDIVFNSNISWKVNSNYDLETVAMHEMGHALGLDHSALGTAVMYAYYNNIKQNLTADDIAGIQSVYGAYPSDPTANGSIDTAQNITGLINSNGQIALAGQSMAGTSDVDYFAVTVPANTTGTMVVSMQSSNLSSVAPKVLVARADRTSIGSASLPNVYGGTATFTVTNVTPGQVYYIRCAAASALGSYGAYGLLVNFGSTPQAPIAPPNTVVPQQFGLSGVTLSDDMLTAQKAQGRNGSRVKVGNVNALGDVLMAAAGSFDRLDPNGLSIPVAPGGVSSLATSVVQFVDAMLTAVAPSQANAGALKTLDQLLDQWWSDDTLSTRLSLWN